MQQNNNLTKPPFVTLAIAFALLVFFGYNHFFNEKNPATLTSESEFNKLYYETVDCAALMAVTESINKGELSPASNIFNLVGYTLGQAQDYAAKAGIDIKQVKSQYDHKTIAHYLRLTSATEEELADSQKQANDCVAKARHYDPKTMIQAAIEEAKKQ